MDSHLYALWFENSPFDGEQEELARRAARTVMDRHFGAGKVVAAHDAALATGQRYVGQAEKTPEEVSLWLDAINEAYRAAWSAAGLPPMTDELYRDNPQLADSCVMVGRTFPSHACAEGGLTFRVFDAWVEWSVFEPFDDPSVAGRAREELWARFGSQEAVLEARRACELAGGLFAPEPQALQVAAWREAIRSALANAIEDIARYDADAGERILAHPNLKRCHIEVGRCRPEEFGGPPGPNADFVDDNWRTRWLVDLEQRPQARHASGMAFAVDESVPQLRVELVPSADGDERLEGAWHVQRPADVVGRLAAQALQLVLERKIGLASEQVAHRP